MPAWLTVEELQARYGEERVNRLADRDGDNSPDDGVIEGAILDAEGTGKAILAQRYEPSLLPTTTADASRDLKRATAQVAWYYLHAGAYDVVSEQVLREHDEGKAWFRAASNGNISLLLAASPEVDQARATVVVARRSSSLREQGITLAAMDEWGRA